MGAQSNRLGVPESGLRKHRCHVPILHEYQGSALAGHRHDPGLLLDGRHDEPVRSLADRTVILGLP